MKILSTKKVTPKLIHDMNVSFFDHENIHKNQRKWMDVRNQIEKKYKFRENYLKNIPIGFGTFNILSLEQYPQFILDELFIEMYKLIN